MKSFMQAFDESERSYLSHYGVSGMRWGVRKEVEPTEQHPAAEKSDVIREKAASKVADAIRVKKGETVQTYSKRIRNMALKGAAIAAIAGGIIGAVAHYTGKYASKNDSWDSFDRFTNRTKATYYTTDYTVNG